MAMILNQKKVTAQRFCFELGIATWSYIFCIDRNWIRPFIDCVYEPHPEFDQSTFTTPERMAADLRAVKITAKLNQDFKRLSNEDLYLITGEWAKFDYSLDSFVSAIMSDMKTAALSVKKIGQDLPVLFPEFCLQTSDGRSGSFIANISEPSKGDSEPKGPSEVRKEDSSINARSVVTRNQIARRIQSEMEHNIDGSDGYNVEDVKSLAKELNQLNKLWIESGAIAGVTDSIKKLLNQTVCIEKLLLKDQSSFFVPLGILLGRIQCCLEFDQRSLSDIEFSDIFQVALHGKEAFGTFANLGQSKYPEIYRHLVAMPFANNVEEQNRPIHLLRKFFDNPSTPAKQGIMGLSWISGTGIISREGIDESVDLSKNQTLFELFKVLAKSDNDRFVPADELQEAYPFRRTDKNKELISQPISKLRKMLFKLKIGIEPSGDESYRLSDSKGIFSPRKKRPPKKTS
jgi:hypothetical protein